MRVTTHAIRNHQDATIVRHRKDHGLVHIASNEAIDRDGIRAIPNFRVVSEPIWRALVQSTAGDISGVV
jgi:hypothetical protein